MSTLTLQLKDDGLAAKAKADAEALKKLGASGADLKKLGATEQNLKRLSGTRPGLQQLNERLQERDLLQITDVRERAQVMARAAGLAAGALAALDQLLDEDGLAVPVVLQ
ncbi:hypothetical protein MKK69_01690 [Methylobacterium sp. J-026]|uniref:hypothetical protein n=1 Tax=Methylobacterium sp. J-026 TaxID=2836624 RepID=UPI001FBB940F|nr:hypothetical protein [Methylobacterium sp. J-026]MCJ2132788.1 hypothetical protein [Methylobacterium sp. J-026]